MKQQNLSDATTRLIIEDNMNNTMNMDDDGKNEWFKYQH